MNLIINGYEFGQWLRLLLWTGVPIAVFFTLVTTWINYRRTQKLRERLFFSLEGGDGRVELGNEEFSAGDAGGGYENGGDDSDDYSDGESFSYRNEEEYKENLYKGILWMKEKYEQYRDLADQRYDRLKEHLTRMEKKYEELLESVRNANPSPPAGTAPQLMPEPEISDAIGLTEIREAETQQREFSGDTEIVVERAELGDGAAAASRVRIQELEEQLARIQQRFDEEVGRMRNQLEEKQRMIADLEGRQSTDRIKIDELVTKLRNNSQLLMNIYQELDKSLHFSDTPPQG